MGCLFLAKAAKALGMGARCGLEPCRGCQSQHVISAAETVSSRIANNHARVNVTGLMTFFGKKLLGRAELKKEVSEFKCSPKENHLI